MVHIHTYFFIFQVFQKQGLPFKHFRNGINIPLTNKICYHRFVVYMIIKIKTVYFHLGPVITAFLFFVFWVWLWFVFFWGGVCFVSLLPYLLL